MKQYLEITDVVARQILDSRGNPTVEVEVVLDETTVGRASVPSGASTGSFEAVELRDGDKNNYLGKSVEKAVENVNTKIRDLVLGMNALEQAEIDKALNLMAHQTKQNLVLMQFWEYLLQWQELWQII